MIEVIEILKTLSIDFNPAVCLMIVLVVMSLKRDSQLLLVAFNVIEEAIDSIFKKHRTHSMFFEYEIIPDKESIDSLDPDAVKKIAFSLVLILIILLTMSLKVLWGFFLDYRVFFLVFCEAKELFTLFYKRLIS